MKKVGLSTFLMIAFCIAIPKVLANDLQDILQKWGKAKVVSEIQSQVSKVKGKIVFVRQKNLWIANADGKNARQLTKSRDCFEPNWDSTGTKIVYVRTTSTQFRPTGYLWCYDLKSGSVKKISNSPKHCLPQWSPDGRWIAFLTAQPQIAELTIYNLDIVASSGGKSKTIKKGVGSKGYALAWSPDSRRLSYAAGEEPRIEIIELSNPARASVIYTCRIQSPFNSINNLQWFSPTQILFVEQPLDAQEGLGWKVMAIDLSSGRSKVILSQMSESGDNSCQYCFLGRENIYWAATSHFTMGGEVGSMTLYMNSKAIVTINNAHSPNWTPIN